MVQPSRALFLIPRRRLSVILIYASSHKVSQFMRNAEHCGIQIPEHVRGQINAPRRQVGKSELVR